MRAPTGVRRLVSPGKQEKFPVLSFSWWFLESPLLGSSGRESILATLERLLPEALPKRYGLHEPPQHKYPETGKQHLLQFMEEIVHDMMVWCPHRPVVSFHLGQPKPGGASKMGFRTNRVEIEVESSALSQPGWADNLRLFWRQISTMLKPIYGEVRTLGGRERRGATVLIARGSELGKDSAQLNLSWWWRGGPKKL